MSVKSREMPLPVVFALVIKLPGMAGALAVPSCLDVIGVCGAGEKCVDVLVLPVQSQELTHDIVSTALVILAACEYRYITGNQITISCKLN